MSDAPPPYGSHQVEGPAAAQAWQILVGPVIGHLSVTDALGPYVTPVCLGESEGRLFFHTGSGRRARALALDPRVCVSVTADVTLHPAGQPCGVGYLYRSVLVFGRAVLLEDEEARLRALDAIVRRHHEPAAQGTYDTEVLAQTLVYEIEVDAVTYKDRD